MMKIMIDRGLFDRDEASKVKGFSDLERSLKDYTPDRVSAITGIDEEELNSLTETLANAETRMLCLSISATENAKGLDTVLAASNLINLLGDDPDTIQIPAEYANTFGLYRMGVRPDARALHKPVGNGGKGILKMLYEPGSIKALYVMGADPAVSLPNTSRVIDGLKSLDLLVVQDIALTETARLAHVVLPAASWAEKDGSFTNTEGVEQEICKVIEPAGQSLPDWRIIGDLALAMGRDIGIRNREDISREINSLPAASQDSSPTTRAFIPVNYKPGEEPDVEYPLNMVVRDVLQHAGSMSTRSQFLNLVVPEAILEMNEKDAEKLGITENCHVKISSRRGAAFLKATFSADVPAGVVYVPAHFPHSGVGALTYPGNGGVSMDAVRVEIIGT